MGEWERMQRMGMGNREIATGEWGIGTGEWGNGE